VELTSGAFAQGVRAVAQSTAPVRRTRAAAPRPGSIRTRCTGSTTRASLEQARLVAWLRRLGMPLAVIRSVSGLPPAQAAGELAGYWATVEAEDRGQAGARHLPHRLTCRERTRERDTAMSDSQGTLTVRYGVRSDIGLHREDNEDARLRRSPATRRRRRGWAATRPARWPARAVIDALRPAGHPRCRPASC